MYKFSGNLKTLYTTTRHPDQTSAIVEKKQDAIKEAVKAGVEEIYRWVAAGKEYAIDSVYGVDGKCMWRNETPSC